MKLRLIILFLLCTSLIIWGCKKDSIIDKQPPEQLPDTLPEQLPDSLDWNDSISGRYMLYGIRSGSYMAFDTLTHSYYPASSSDTIERVLNVVYLNNSTINIHMDSVGYSTNIEIASLNIDSSTYYISTVGSGWTTYKLKFVNNTVDSIYYYETVSYHTATTTIGLAGVRIQ